MLTPLQPEDGGRWQPNLFGELGESLIATLNFQEPGELFVQWWRSFWIINKNLSNRTLQAVDNLLQGVNGDVLLTDFEPLKS